MIVWLASYPKSGNTWFRIFLANLLAASTRPVSINTLVAEGLSNASARRPFDDATGVDSEDLTDDEIDALRPDVYRAQARAADELIFRKVHDAWSRLPNGRPMFPPDVTRAVLYFIRNPLDVCVSFAFHRGDDHPASAVRLMLDPDAAWGASPVHRLDQLRQRLGSWSGHVRSWVDESGLDVRVVRYEDLQTRPFETFMAAARFVGLPHDAAQIRRAVAFSRFDEVRRQEDQDGFAERPDRAVQFFRAGRAGAWRDHLSAAQKAALVDAHGPTMRRFGYLDDAGHPVY
jgi:hypothetical protein